MKERPILFSAPMVRAILDGRKTQTRRAVKLRGNDGVQASHEPWRYLQADSMTGNQAALHHDGMHLWQHRTDIVRLIEERCPFGQPGGRLWVRESWAYHPDFPESVRRVIHRAERGVEHDVDRWRPSIHMPRWACRILLEITAVRVERLQDISDNDIEAEGTAQWVKDGGKVMCPRPGFDGWWPDENGNLYVKPNRVAFCSLWESVNGLCAWDANPWVWVIEFKRVEGGES